MASFSSKLQGMWATNKAVATAEEQDTQLPENWERRVNESGQEYFVDHNNGVNNWERPPQLPAGWEMKYSQEHSCYFFVDHNTKTSSYTPPAPAAAEASSTSGMMSSLRANMNAASKTTRQALTSEEAQNANKTMQGWLTSMAKKTAVVAQKIQDSVNDYMNQPPAGPPPAQSSAPPPPAYFQPGAPAQPGAPVPYVEAPMVAAPAVPSMSGNLKVTLISAMGLNMVNENNQGGLAQVFVQALCSLVGGIVNEKVTKHSVNNATVSWNETFTWTLGNTAQEGNLEFVVLDHNEGGERIEMGRFYQPIGELLAQPSFHLGKAYQLTTQGSVVVELKFEPF